MKNVNTNAKTQGVEAKTKTDSLEVVWNNKPTKRDVLTAENAKILLKDKKKAVLKVVDKKTLKQKEFIFEPSETLGGCLNNILNQLNVNHLALKYAHSENKDIKKAIKEENNPIKKESLKAQLVDTSNLITSVCVIIEQENFNICYLLKANMFKLQVQSKVIEQCKLLAGNLNKGLN